MPYYKTPDNKPWFLDEGVNPADIESFPKDAVPIEEPEALELSAQLAGKFIKTQFYPNEYLDRFTEEEQIAIVTAAMSNPRIKIWYTKIGMESFVDINDPRVASGLDVFIDAGLLDAGRKDALLKPLEI